MSTILATKTVATAYTKAFALNAICCRENEGETRAEARLGVCAQSQIRDGGSKKGGRSEKSENEKDRRRKDALSSA